MEPYIKKEDFTMPLDPTKHADWEIAEDAEKSMATIYEIGERLGLTKEELLPQGHYIGKIDYRTVLERLKDKPNGKYIDVTAITPTPLGEGKSTSSMGLVQGFGKIGKNVCAAIRQPSGGPTMNIKGSAAGGGLAQCIPLTPFSLGFTGDINAIMNAHNLAMVALTSRMQHERNYTDEQLQRLSNMERLDIDPTKVEMGWIMDFCVQALRNIIIGIDGVNGKSDGFMMKSKFGIAVSSEVMAILSVATSLKDMRERMGKIVVAYNKKGNPVTTEDLQVAGAMTGWMVSALNPSLMQTLEGQPVIVHAANIAIGQSSIIADLIGLKLADYHVTASGFGADIGFEKFWNLKCRFSKLVPDAAVVVATIRALKCHGGAPVPVPGAGISPVVCINAFYTDTDDEIAKVRELAEAAGAKVALSRHWEKGGDGAIEFAETVVAACEEKSEFKFLYELDQPVKDRIEIVAKEVYGADGVEYSPEANASLARIQKDPELSKLGLCMVKTHLSLSDNPALKGVPTGWKLKVREVLTYGGAQFIVPVAGAISLMPGTGSNPAFRRIDVDTETGKVKGVF
jgi:formate--tetrahydrofolate ligase